MANILEIIIFIVVIKIFVKYLLTSQKNIINKIQKPDVHVPKKIYYINEEFVSIQADNQTDNQFEIDNIYWEPILMNKSISYSVVRKRDINLTDSNWIIR
jgi:hypothetical protein